MVHSSLDLVDEMQWAMTSNYLKIVDKFGSQLVSAYITAGGARFMMLHDNINADTLRSFFMEAHEMYIKVKAIIALFY